MHPFLKIFRSRFFLAALCVVLKFVQLIVVFVLAIRYVLPLTILSVLLHIVVLLYLINKDDVPEGKVPWLILILAVPIVGAFVFLLLTSQVQDREKLKRFSESKKKLQPYLKQKESFPIIKVQDSDAWLQANYIFRAANMPCTRYSDVHYYALGEQFHAALLDCLRMAEHFIFMEYFIIQQGEMWNPIHEILKAKAAQGVKIYLMYDDVGCMFTLPENYSQILSGEGIHCALANRFTPVLSHIHNNRDHRKITVIDGKIGFTGGINLADEYINTYEKYGHWKDTAIKVEGEAVKNLMALFLSNWNMQSDLCLDIDAFMNLASPDNKGKGVAIAYGDGPSPWYQESIGKNVYLNMIHAARKYVYITTPYLICDSELMNALGLAAKKGVDIRLITPHIPDKKSVYWMTRSSYRQLIAAGVKIYEYTPGFIHGKNFICDDKFAVCGTINLDYRSLVHHFECGLWMYDTDCIKDMKADFLQTQEQSEQISLEQADLKGWKRLAAELMKVFAPLF